MIDRVGCSHAFSEAEWKKVKQMYSIAGGALSFILALIGVLNFVNVITTSILSRKQEFAMMESIGMTVGQQKWILRLEGLFYAVLTIFISVSLGSAISYAVVRAVTAQMWMFEYHFTLSDFIQHTNIASDHLAGTGILLSKDAKDNGSGTAS